jgi:mannose-6-phosphate isomerase-like protein (cupin superfamily)
VITVEPAQETSVHFHRMRDETWVVLDVGLTIEIGNRVLRPEPGDELQVPAEEPHRIRCDEHASGRVLQIAFGYQSDDDRLPVEGGPPGDG